MGVKLQRGVKLFRRFSVALVFEIFVGLADVSLDRFPCARLRSCDRFPIRCLLRAWNFMASQQK